MTPWTLAYQAPMSMEFSRQEYWKKGPITFCLGRRTGVWRFPEPARGSQTHFSATGSPLARRLQEKCVFFFCIEGSAVVLASFELWGWGNPVWRSQAATHQGRAGRREKQGEEMGRGPGQVCSGRSHRLPALPQPDAMVWIICNEGIPCHSRKSLPGK